MIYFEDNAREALLEHLNKPKKKLSPPCGKGTVLKKFKEDKSGESIYIIDHDDNGIPDDDIINSIKRQEDFINENDVQLFEDKNISEKYIVIFNQDFPEWMIKALNGIGKRPSDFGFLDQKGKFHAQIREKERKEGFKKILIELNRSDSHMLQTLKTIFNQINHKPV